MKQVSSKNKTAFVHDFLVSYGGAERVLESLIKLDLEAPIYTLLYDPDAMKGRFSGREIRTSFLQKLPKFFRKRYRFLLPLFAVAAESLDLREFDTVISSSGAWSNGIVTRLRTMHIAYLHSPMRLLWDTNERYLDTARLRGPGRFLGRLYLSYLRVWDREAADRPDMLVSNSEYTRERALKYYRRDSVVVHPAVTLSEYSHPSDGGSHPSPRKAGELPSGRGSHPSVPNTGQLPSGRGAGEREDFFLVVSRLTASKGIDIAIEAFNKLQLPLRIVGEGRERRHLESFAKKNIDFLGSVDDAELVSLYRLATAVIVPSEEDFGMAAAEAVSLGTPAIVLDKGGTAEIVTEGKTGEYFGAATPEVLADAVRRFLARGTDAYVVDPDAGKWFSEDRFLSTWRALLAKREEEIITPKFETLSKCEYREARRSDESAV